MKTQMVSGAYEPVFFPKPPAKSGIPGRAHGGSPFFPRPSSEPVVAALIPANTPGRHDYSGLPASLADWLVCKEALDICRKGGNGMDHGSDARVGTAKPATRAKILPAAIACP